MNITICPSCGSEKFKKILGPVSHVFEGKTYTVPAITHYDCPECGERLYEPDAVSEMQAVSPAFHGAPIAR